MLSLTVREAASRFVLVLIAIHLAVRPAILPNLSTVGLLTGATSSLSTPAPGPQSPSIAHSRSSHGMFFPVKAMVASTVVRMPDLNGFDVLVDAMSRVNPAHRRPLEHPPA